MKIYISDCSLTKYGIHHTFELEVEQAEPIAKIVEAVGARGIKGPLVFADKRLDHFEDRCPLDFNIVEESTLHIMPTQDSNSNGSYDYKDYNKSEEYSLRYHLDLYGDSGSRIRAIRELAAKYGFDPQTYIVEPDAHFEWLKALETYVATRSEFNVSPGPRYYATDYEATDESFNFFGAVEVPLHMAPYVRLVLRQSTNFGPHATPTQPTSTTFGSLMKSYLILTRLIDTFDSLVSEGFVQSASPPKEPYYSLFVERPNSQVAELIAIDRAFLERLHKAIETSVQMLTDGETAIRPYTAELDESVRHCLFPVLTVLTSFIASLSEDARLVIRESEESLCRLCRMTVLLCDLALLSYVGSHGCRFDVPRERYSMFLPVRLTRYGLFSVRSPFRSVRSGLRDVFSFRCDLRRLTCLDGLIGSQPVCVFRLNLDDGADLFKEPAQGLKGPKLSVVTTIEMLADIWGPVHGVPSATEENKIIQYNISKGAIRRTEKRPGDITYKNAVTCHWEDWGSYKGGLYSRFSRFFLPKSPDLYFSPNDLLLIGADGFVANDACRYTLDYFQDDYGEKLRDPGTRHDEWRDDSRSLALSFSKIFGISFGMTAKLIPKTTLKQTIWDAWNNKKANPILLQCYYGVEVSHCTGNADRVPLKAFFRRDGVLSQLDLQFSRTWRTESWAVAFLQALELEDSDSFLQYWADLKDKNREGVMSLVSFLLEALKDTGTAGDIFQAMLFHSGEGRVLPISVKNNTWAAFLRDEPHTAAYACIRPCCVEASPELGMPECSHCSQGTWDTRTRTLLRIQAEVKADPPWKPISAVEHIATCQEFHVARDGTALGGCLVLSEPPWRFTPSKIATMTEQRSCLNILPALRSKAIEVCIMSSAKSFGGMDRARSSVALRSTGGHINLSHTWIGARSTGSFAASVATQDSSYADDDTDDDDNNNDNIDDADVDSVIEKVGAYLDNDSTEMVYSDEEAGSSFHSDDSTRMYHPVGEDAIHNSQTLLLPALPQAVADPGGIGNNIRIAMPAETLPTDTMNEVAAGTHGHPPLIGQKRAGDVQQAPLPRLRRRPPFHNKPWTDNL